MGVGFQKQGDGAGPQGGRQVGDPAVVADVEPAAAQDGGQPAQVLDAHRLPADRVLAQPGPDLVDRLTVQRPFQQQSAAWFTGQAAGHRGEVAGRPSLGLAAGARMDRHSEVSGAGRPKTLGESIVILGPLNPRSGREPRGGPEDPVELGPPEIDHVEVRLARQRPQKVDAGVDGPDAVHELRIAGPPPGKDSVEGPQAPQALLPGRIALDAGVLQGLGGVGVAERSGKRQIAAGHPEFQPGRAQMGLQPGHRGQRHHEVADGAGNDRKEMQGPVLPAGSAIHYGRAQRERTVLSLAGGGARLGEVRPISAAGRRGRADKGWCLVSNGAAPGEPTG